MEASINERLSAIEAALGISDRTDVKPSEIDIYTLRKSLENKHLCLSNISSQQLRKLVELMEQPDHRSLSDKLTSFQCCEELARQRAELLEEFESRLPTVLDCSHLSLLDSQQQQLDDAAAEVTNALEAWKEHHESVEQFKFDCKALLQAAVSRLLDLEMKINAKTAKQDA